MPRPVFGLSSECAWARHRGLTIWLIEPAIMLTQLDADTHIATEHAALLVGPATEALLELIRRSEARASFFHDFRGMSSYESAARTTLASWPLRFGKGNIDKIHVLLDPSGAPLLRMAATAVEMAVSALGFSQKTYWSPMEFVTELPADVRSKTASAMLRSGLRARLTAPARGSSPAGA